MTAIIDAVSSVPDALSVADGDRAVLADPIVPREPRRAERLDQGMRPAVGDRPGHSAAAGLAVAESGPAHPSAPKFCRHERLGRR